MRMATPPEVREARAERKAATRETMLAVYERIAEDDSAPHVAQIMAADKWLDRIEGKPAQINQHSGPEGGPMIHRIERVIIDPKN